MKPHGLIYDARRNSKKHGEIILVLPIILRIFYRIFQTLGVALIVFVIFTFIFAFGPVIEQEISYELRQNEKTDELQIKIVEAEKILEVQKKALEWGVDSYFSVVIPKIGASSNILANVDAGNKKEYLEALKKGVAHAKGTYFPGQEGRIVLFSHSTDSPLNFARYNAVFYLLRKLDKGNEILIFFANKLYIYEVEEKIVVQASDTSWLNPRPGNEELILITCDPPGTTLRRLLVIAKPKNTIKT